MCLAQVGASAVVSEPARPYDFEADLRCWADYYASAGWPVFPLHGPRKQPRALCDCAKGDDCEHAAKHPRTLRGLTDASTDEGQIERWWRMFPRANVGVAVPHGYVVLDIDGMEGIDAIAAEGWQIPETVTASTARGWHHWFTADVEVRPGSGFLPHVDLRGPGGYVCAPPSLHKTGIQYEWERSPIEHAIAPAPAWIYELVRRARERHRHEPSAACDGPILQGGRNDTLTRIAGYLRRRPECSERVILAALEALNEERCRPPLERDELEMIAHSVGRYSPEQAAARQDWEPYGWESQAW